MNTIAKVNEAILAFQNLFNSKRERKNNEKLIASLLTNAKYINFGKVSFENLNPDEKYRMYLAYENNLLYGVLLKESEDFYQDKTITNAKYYVSSFNSQALKIDPNLTPTLTLPNQISYSTLAQRMINWEKDYYTWMVANLDEGFLVDYFEIDSANFSQISDNNGVFGLINTSDVSYEKTTTYSNLLVIDFAVISDTGYMDVVRPVPPFKPIRF